MFCDVASVLKSRKYLGYGHELRDCGGRAASWETLRRLKSELH